MTRLTVSIVSEDPELLESVKNLVESVGLSAATFPTLQGLLEGQERESCGCFVFCPDRNTLEDPAQQARLAAACARQPGILISEGGDVEMAVRALKAGVLDIVPMPYRDRQLLEQIRGALDASTDS